MSPQFPPLLTGHELKPGQSPARKAAAGAKKGKYGAGDLLWVNNPHTLSYAIVLEPDVDRIKALDMLFTQMVALGDAIGATAPPEVAVQYIWPNVIQANGAQIGSVNIILSEDDGEDGCPRYMVIATEIAVRPEATDMNPGFHEEKTTLWDEGCGEITVNELLDSSARHFMAWVHTWEEEGFKPVLTQLDGRMIEQHALNINDIEGTYLGMDESANVLVKLDKGTTQIAIADALDTRLEAFVE